MTDCLGFKKGINLGRFHTCLFPTSFGFRKKKTLFFSFTRNINRNGFFLEGTTSLMEMSGKNESMFMYNVSQDVKI